MHYPKWDAPEDNFAVLSAKNNMVLLREIVQGLGEGIRHESINLVFRLFDSGTEVEERSEVGHGESSKKKT
jgi:hypothetical protein